MDEKVSNYNIKNLIKGILLSVFFTLLSLLVLSFILSNTDASESIISPCIIVITAVSILLGSMLSTLKQNKNGLLSGVCVGGIYVIVLYFVSSIVNHSFVLGLDSFAMIALAMLAGSLGGIIGVNIKVK